MDGLPFALGDMKIDGAERVTGYIALKADDAFRLEAESSETLERRDGRTTPVAQATTPGFEARISPCA